MSEFGDKPCDERHRNCGTRMTSQADDIDKLFDTKASNKTLYWTLGIFFVLILGGFGYTQTVNGDVKKVAEQVNEVVKSSDMEKFQNAIIQAIRED